MLPYNLNAFLGAIFTILLVLIDYSRKYNTDTFQRRLFFAVLLATLVSVLMDFTDVIAGGRPGTAVHYILYTALSVFLVAQNVAFYLSFVFIDYFTYKNEQRSRKILKVLAFFLAAYLLVILLNLRFRFFFYISDANVYTPSTLYPLRLVVSYFSLVLAFVEVIFSTAHFTPAQIRSIIFFGVIIGAGSGLDVLWQKSSLIWPCFTAGLLYLYFFIIQSDLGLDSLTGLGNRSTFNEFMNRISRSASKDAYAIVMIDMDHFKEINDTLGHLEGDNALRDMAAIIKSSVRQSDFAARYGGDEFIIAAKFKTNIDRLMERLQHSIDAHNEKGRRRYKLEMSYGWDVFAVSAEQPTQRSIEEFIAHIDKLMYENKMAKRTGRPSAAPQTTGRP